MIKIRPSSLLMMCGCISSSIASLISRSMYPILTERSFVSCTLIMWSWLMLCSATADLSGCASQSYMSMVLFDSELDGSTALSNTNDKPNSTAYIPYTQTTYGRLSRMLAKHNIKIVTLSPRKIFSYLPPVKDALGLWTPSVYSIPRECGRVYIGQSVRSIQLRIKEHNRHIRLTQPDKSALAELSINHDHISNHTTQN